MERRNFLKSFGAIMAIPSILTQIEIEEPQKAKPFVEPSAILDHSGNAMSAKEVLRIYFETGVLICQRNVR